MSLLLTFGGDVVSGGTAPVPTLVSATVQSNGATVVLVFSIAVTDGDGTGFTLDDAGTPSVLEYLSGNGTATLIYNNPNDPVLAANVCTIDYAGSGVVAVAGGQALAAITDAPVTNNSTQ